MVNDFCGGIPITVDEDEELEIYETIPISIDEEELDPDGVGSTPTSLVVSQMTEQELCIQHFPSFGTMPEFVSCAEAMSLGMDQGLDLVHMLLACAETVGCRDAQQADLLLSKICKLFGSIC